MRRLSVLLVSSDACGWQAIKRALAAHPQITVAGETDKVLAACRLATELRPDAVIAVELFARQLVLESLPLPASTALPLSSALRGLIAALAVGLVAGLLPAFRAARASVVQALRG